MDKIPNRKAGKIEHHLYLPNNQNSIARRLPSDSKRVPRITTGVGNVSTYLLQPNKNLKIAGRLQHFKHEWRKLTSDPEIMDMINGL